MAITRYCIHADSDETDGLLRNQDSFVLVPDQPSQEHVEVGINDCSGFFPAVRWLDKEDDYVPAGVDFFQKGVPCLVSWDADNTRWIIGAAAQTINDRIWLGIPADVTVGTGNARMSFVAIDNRVQTCHLTGGRPASTVVLHNGRRSGGLVRVKFLEHGVAILHKGIALTEDFEMPAGSKLELVCLTSNVYSLVIYNENSGGPGFMNSDMVYTEASLYAKNNTPYGVNTTNDVIGIVLPQDPVKDNFCEVLDVSGNCLNRYCYVIPNPANPGYSIDNKTADEPFIIDLAWGQCLFVYDGNENWAINPDAIGAEGEDGAQGPQGYQGPHGVQGNPGVPGPQGEDGVSDIPGPQGAPGPQGEQGDTGPQGDDGVSNIPGPQGFQGEKGDKGDTGSQGATGSQGPTGSSGAQGAVGATGPQGATGADSTVPGPQGPQGDTGSQGPQGFQGEEGSGSQAHDLDFHVDVNVPAPNDGQVLTWDVATSMWIPKTPRTVVGVTEFDYRMTLPITSTPTTGRVSRDNADPSLATIIYMHKLDTNGDDMTLFIQAMQAGDWLNLHDDANVNDAEQYDVTGPPVLTGDVFAIPVISFDVVGTPLINNQVLRVFWRVTEEGLQGPQGPQGETGAQGDTGAQGPQGFQGNDGADGTDGIDGAQGATGAQGPTGAAGAQGDDGATGPQGADSTVPGPQGDTGPQGATGAQGADSTVPGPQGDSGADGVDGAQGATGAQGADGADGGTGPQGATGAQGTTGAQGDTGPQGVAGTPSTVPGPQGDDGATGAQGEKGAQGDTGNTGGTGPQGAKGAQGAAGATGNTGPQGAKGTTGNTGPQGRSVVVTVNANAPGNPVAGDVWIKP